ncbi:hypothetical protein FHP25_14755 [Vineibacter terrae]|uniref:Uncharacterized protein n=1 Tax=Vineibacter terrae TaxID=2586908 RepID=A0A5C8PMJ9_9HYPH|nr:hypothetical protein [Vineibacter terrae]TXL75142.1 hypothetical protein FHP25_14755 [Vineibacter terrae]
MPGSGSETRQRGEVLKTRCTKEEAALFRTWAKAAGVSVPSLMRYAMFGIAPPRASRQPQVNVQEVARLIGEMGQLKAALKEVAAKGSPEACDRAHDAACRDIADMCYRAFTALGREP